MSSQALYRKWRSQTFNDLVGQAHIVQALRNAMASGRIGHAYLFTGPRGVGKTSAARILAKAVNCEAALTERPCGVCAACEAIAAGRAIDVIEMDAASHTSVDDAREIIERVQFRPTSFRYKVYVVDEAHMLSTAAFNALLKTLEEPPDHAMFILATTEFHKVPATIVSRCQRFVFNRHTVQDTVAHLEHIAAEEGIRLEAGVGEAIARAATGSMRDAVSVLDQLIGYGDSVVPLERVRSLLGATSAEEVYTLTAALAAGDTAAALRAINAVSDQGADLRQFTRDMVGHLRGLMLLKANGDPALLDIGVEALAAMHASAAALELATLLHWLKLFSGLDHQLRTSPYGQLPLELVVIEALMSPAPQVEAVRQASQQRPVRPASQAPQPAKPVAAASDPAPVRPAPPAAASDPAPAQPAPPTAVPIAAASAIPEPNASVASGSELDPGPAANVASQLTSTSAPHLDLGIGPAAAAATEQDDIVLTESEVFLAEIEGLWPQIIDEIKPYDPTIQALLRSCDPVRLEDGMLVIGAYTPFHHKKLESNKSQQIIEKVISKLTQRTVVVRCELISKEQQSRVRDARRQREDLMKDDIVKAARNIFGARILGVQED